jgi:hypothetical protein
VAVTDGLVVVVVIVVAADVACLGSIVGLSNRSVFVGQTIVARACRLVVQGFLFARREKVVNPFVVRGREDDTWFLVASRGTVGIGTIPGVLRKKTVMARGMRGACGSSCSR